MASLDKLKFYLKEKKMTQRVPAQRVKRNPCTVSRWLSGETTLQMLKLTVVADALALTV